MRRIHARKTSIKVIENEEADLFVALYHKQSVVLQKNKRNIGLFYADELVAVAQFCFPRTAAKKLKYSTELLRLCFKKDTQVIGGASKLVKYYIEKYNPADIFTYQDTTGENTNVYEHCGFTLVSQDKKKQYLVTPGKTLKTADRKNKEVLSVHSVVQLGPDKLLGTSLGEEQFKEDGSRKTNIELFQDLGWHIEETTGDKVYEWVNSAITFYTYKITADGSDKYYYGVHKIAVPFNDFEEINALTDGYFGSGGTKDNNKFNNWKKKYRKQLHKEIVGIFERKSEAYHNEKELVGELWKTDPLCLNSVAGGYFSGGSTGPSVTEGYCEIHGFSKMSNSYCFSCKSLKQYSEKECTIHGLTLFRTDNCCKCTTILKTDEGLCEKHGVSKFQFGKCCKCTVDSQISLKICNKHGKVKHIGEVCYYCNSINVLNVKECKIHGETVFVADTCAKCRAEKNVEKKHCDKHGEVKFIGERCYLCIQKEIAVKECAIHGNTKFIGETCCKCSKQKQFNTQYCSFHGETLFAGDNCCQCKTEKSISIKECPTHGRTKHIGVKCFKCRKVSPQKIDIKKCKYHGKVPHSLTTGNCKKCGYEKSAHSRGGHKTPKKTCVLCHKER